MGDDSKVYCASVSYVIPVSDSHKTARGNKAQGRLLRRFVSIQASSYVAETGGGGDG